MTVALMVAGGVAVIVAWRVVATGRSIWPVMGTTLGILGLLSVATGDVPLSPAVDVWIASAVGLGAGLALYLATVAFVVVVRRWPMFDRHVQEIYDQRKGLSLGLALLLAAGVAAPGEELFWRGFFQANAAEPLGWVGAAALTWAAYLLANLASWNLPIVAGAVVGGAVWGALALWTHGVLASLLCHVVWTGLMLGVPPGGSKARAASAGEVEATSEPRTAG